MKNSNALSHDIVDDEADDADVDLVPRISGTRRVAPPASANDDEAGSESSDRPTVRVPKFALLGGGAGSDAYAAVLTEGGLGEPAEPDPSELPTVPAPPRTAEAKADDCTPSEAPTRPPPSYRDLGSLQRVPRLVCSPEQLRKAALDHKQAFVLVLVDGRLDIETILDATPMAMHEVLRILLDLLGQGLIAID
jgi:hypothetical protein